MTMRPARAATTARRVVALARVAVAMLAAGTTAGPHVARAGDEALTPRSMLHDAGALARAPLDADARAWARAGAIAAATGALVAWWDDDIERYRSRAERPTAWKPVHALARLAEPYGSGSGRPVILAAGLSGALYVAGRARDDARLRRTAGLVAEAAAFQAVLATGIKLLTGRARPEAGVGPHDWSGPGTHAFDRRSFVSGHTSTAVAIATVISERHRGWAPRVAVWGFALAAALQRIDSGAHWTSDVVAGAALGWGVGHLVSSRHDGDARDVTGSLAPARVMVTIRF